MSYPGKSGGAEREASRVFGRRISEEAAIAELATWAWGIYALEDPDAGACLWDL